MSNDEQFLTRLADVLEVDPKILTADFPVADRWDSMSTLSAVALIDDIYGTTVSGGALETVRTVADLLDVIHASARG